MISDTFETTGGDPKTGVSEFNERECKRITRASRLPSAADGPEILRLSMDMHPEMVFLQFDGFDHALIGCLRVSGGQYVLVYSYSRMVEIMRLRDAMSREDASEFIDFNCSTYPGREGDVFYPIIFEDF